MGTKISRTQIELTEGELECIAARYHAWRGDSEAGEYADEPGFCRSAAVEYVEEARFALTPGRYVGAEASEELEGAFDERMTALVTELRADFAQSERLASEVKRALGAIGYDLA
jgi:type I restriction enzyme M protein